MNSQLLLFFIFSLIFFIFYFAGPVIRFRPFVCRIDAATKREEEKKTFSSNQSLEHWLLSALFPTALLLPLPGRRIGGSPANLP